MDAVSGYITLFGAVLGIIGLIAGAGFFIRYSATKSNLEGKDETIETVEKSRDAYRERNNELEKLVVGLQAENKTLREIATQTPEILALTKVVQSSVSAQSKVAANVAELTSKLSVYLSERTK